MTEQVPHSPELLAALNRMWDQVMGDRDGRARQAHWLCPDGYMIVRTTTRVVGGPHDGKWVVQLMRPYGKGARGGAKAAERWREVYRRGFATRKGMNARAAALWRQHGGGPTRYDS